MPYYPTLKDVPPSTRNRLAHIDFLLLFQGEANRTSIIERFSVFPNQVTKDFIYYKTLVPNNIFYEKKRRVHIRSSQFEPLFRCHTPKLLSSLVHGFGDGFDNIIVNPLPVSELDGINQPSAVIVAAITRAIHKQSPLIINYISLSSGETTHEIIPHALINNGIRWHVRAYDRKSHTFRDFVLTRILLATVKFESLCKKECMTLHPLSFEETAHNDRHWQRNVELHLVPHPNLQYPKAIEVDYAMVEGKRIIKIKQALAPYLLRLWHVDCSDRGALKDKEYHLWLANSTQIKSLANLNIMDQ